jgi:hypothetical protein
MWKHLFVRRALMLLLAAVALVTFWEIAPAPAWMGRILLWDKGPACRLLLTSGWLLTMAGLLVWRYKLVSPHPVRILIFVFAGPVAGVMVKFGRYHAGLEELVPDFAVSGLLIAAALIACYIPAGARPAVLFSAIALSNVYAFGRFNPLQPAGPIFHPPETEAVRRLRQSQDASPDHVLIHRGFLGAALNGLGFRSVSHALMTPRLDVFRKDFPAMPAEQFNVIFNRFANIEVTDDRMPSVPIPVLIKVPASAFEPVRNVRHVAIEVAPRKECSTQRGGAVDRVTSQGSHLSIEGWAPWAGEDATQELRVISTRAVRADALITLRRPDIAETMKDYAYARSGFHFTISSADGRPLPAAEIALVARNTSQGLAQLRGCGCP